MWRKSLMWKEESGVVYVKKEFNVMGESEDENTIKISNN